MSIYEEIEKLAKTRDRMCRELGDCVRCGLQNKECSIDSEEFYFSQDFKAYEEVVTKWAKENPPETYAQRMRRVMKTINVEWPPQLKGALTFYNNVCIKYIYGDNAIPDNCQEISCTECWYREIE